MFTLLIIANLGLSVAISLLGFAAFRRPLGQLLGKKFGDEAAGTWSRYLLFLVGGLSVAIGTRIWDIERYAIDKASLPITEDLLVLELYRTAIATLACNAAFSLVVLIGIWAAGLTRRNH